MGTTRFPYQPCPFHLLQLAVVTLLIGAACGTAVGNGIGVLGDSSADEYQFETSGDFARASARSWVELLAEYRDLNFGEFAAASRPDARRNGYAFNWARGGAAATGSRPDWDLPDQTRGLAQQIDEGEIDIVFLGLGGNDYGFVSGIGQFFAISNQQVSEPETALFADFVVDRMRRSAEEVLSRGTRQLVLENVEDTSAYPAFGFTTPEGGERVRRAVQLVNEKIKALADELAVPLIDNYELTRMAQQNALHVGGVHIKTSGRTASGAFVDGLHLGTVASGVYANTFLHAIRQAYDVDVEPFSDQELLTIAGDLMGAPISFDASKKTFVDVEHLVSYDRRLEIGGVDRIGVLGWHARANNLARDASASHFPERQPDRTPAAQAIDGDLSTAARTDRGVEDQWWQVDLGTPQELTHVVIHNSSGRGRALTGGSGLLASVLDDQGDVVWEQEVTADFWGPLEIDFAARGVPVVGQGVRLSKRHPIDPRQSILHLNEVEVFGLERSTHLAFLSGDVLSFEIDAGSGLADRLFADGTVSLGGASLEVRSIGRPLRAGDRFDIFHVNDFIGSFGDVALPTLTAGLTWDTADLLVDGTIAVVPEPQGIRACLLVLVVLACGARRRR